MKKVYGKLVSWNDAKGFGFVQVSKAVPDVFAHISEFDNRARKPLVGDSIRFVLVKDSEGRLQASKISFKGEPNRKARKPNKSSRPNKNKFEFTLLIVGLYFAALVAAIILWQQSIYVLASHVVFSFLAFSLYAKDKYHAEKKRWRVKESTLHLISLVGGWPGALIAQQLLRHKTSKVSFQSMFWLTVLLSLGVTMYFHTDEGKQLFSSMSLPIIETPEFLKSNPQIEWSE